MFEALIAVTGAEQASDFQVVMQDGDHEVCIIPASVGEWQFVAVSTAEEPPFVIVQSEHATLLEAVNAMREYLFNEYAGPEDFAKAS